MKASKSASVDQYIKSAPQGAQAGLRQMQETIAAAAPQAKEKIAYGIPTLTYHGNLVHYAGFANHIGFYPTPGGIVKFKKELAKYKQAKGSIQFPLDEPLPLELISKIVKFRVKENESRKKA